jgi:hypothetical protein
LFCIFSTLNPGVVLFSTMKPLTWLSATSRAQTIEMSHHRSVADPALLAVEDPGVAFAFRRGRETTTGPRAHQRLGQREAADLFHARHRRQPLLLLLLGAREVDGIHRETGVDTMEGTERNIGSRDLQGDQADQQGASARAAVTIHAETGDV